MWVACVIVTVTGGSRSDPTFARWTDIITCFSTLRLGQLVSWSPCTQTDTCMQPREPTANHGRSCISCLQVQPIYNERHDCVACMLAVLCFVTQVKHNARPTETSQSTCMPVCMGSPLFLRRSVSTLWYTLFQTLPTQVGSCVVSQGCWASICQQTCHIITTQQIHT